MLLKINECKQTGLNEIEINWQKLKFIFIINWRLHWNTVFWRWFNPCMITHISNTNEKTKLILINKIHEIRFSLSRVRACQYCNVGRKNSALQCRSRFDGESHPLFICCYTVSINLIVWLEQNMNSLMSDLIWVGCWSGWADSQTAETYQVQW